MIASKLSEIQAQISGLVYYNINWPKVLYWDELLLHTLSLKNEIIVPLPQPPVI